MINNTQKETLKNISIDDLIDNIIERMNEGDYLRLEVTYSENKLKEFNILLF